MTARLPAVPKPSKITARLRAAHPLSILVAAAGDRAGICVLEFFALTLPPRAGPMGALWGPFWPGARKRGVPLIAAVQPLHVAARIARQTRERRDPPSVRLAGHQPGDR